MIVGSTTQTEGATEAMSWSITNTPDDELVELANAQGARASHAHAELSRRLAAELRATRVTIQEAGVRADVAAHRLKRLTWVLIALTAVLAIAAVAALWRA
jgi:hypothetical protein